MSGLASKVVPVLILLLIIGIGGVVVDETSKGFSEKFEQERAEARAYCDQVLGEDASLYSGSSYGKHAGYHCESGSYRIHLALVPEQYEQQAYNASQADQDLGWGPESFDAHKDSSLVRSPYPANFELLVTLALVVSASVGLQAYSKYKTRGARGDS